MVQVMAKLRNVDLNLLVAFEVLMRERSVSRAAEKISVTQSAMSHILHRLREQLDDPVLVKTGRGMQPTDRALSLVEPVSRILREIEELLQSPTGFGPRSSQRRFVISATDYMEYLLMPPLIEKLVQEAPGIDIQVQRTQSDFPIQSLEDYSVDMVLGFEVMLSLPSRVHRARLFDDRMACVVRTGHPLAGAEHLELETYLAANHMLISRTGSVTGLVDEWLRERGLERRIGLIVPHFLSAPLIVAQTDMLLSLPLRIAERFLTLAPLQILPLPFELPVFNLVMVWHPLREKDPAHLWLRQQLDQVCRQFLPSTGSGIGGRRG